MDSPIIDISPEMLLFQVINIFILYLILRRFLYRPLTNLMQSRTEEIEQGLEEAKKNQERAKQLQEEYESEIQKARLEAREIIEKASRQKDEIIKEGQDETRRQTEKMLQDAQKELEREKEKAFEELRRDIAHFSVKIAQKIIEREIKPEDQEELVDRYLKEAGRVQ